MHATLRQACTGLDEVLSTGLRETWKQCGVTDEMLCNWKVVIMKRILSLSFGILALAAMQAFSLSVGDNAPDFTLTSTADSSITFSQGQGQVRVLFFFGCGWGISQATGPAVETKIWQAFKNSGVLVYGIEIWNQPKDSVVAFGKEMNVTFPLLTKGYQTAQAYGAQKNYLYLVDKNGVVQDIEMLPATTVTFSQINAAVKAITDKIPVLLNAAVKYRPFYHIGQGFSSMTSPIQSYDLRGRLIMTNRTKAAFQQTFLWKGKKNAPAEKQISGYR
jgi:peroxiredoxin